MADGFTYIPSRYTPPDYVTPAFNTLIDNQQRREATADKERATRDALIYQQYMQLAPDQKQQLFDKLPDSVKSWTFNPATVPAHVKSTLEQTQSDFDLRNAQNKLSSANQFKPTTGDVGALNYDFQTGKNAPKEYLEHGYDAEAMTPSEVHQKAVAPTQELQAKTFNEGQQGLEHGAGAAFKSGPETRKTDAETAFTKGPKTAETYAGAAEKKAQTNKLSVETKNLEQNNNLLGSLFGKGSMGAGVGAGAAALPANLGQGTTQLDQFVRDLADLKADPAMITLMMRKNPDAAIAIEAAARRYDPQFSMADYGVRKKALDNFNSGTDSQVVTNLNRVIGHAASLRKSFGDLHNSDISPINAVVNPVSQKLGLTAGMRGTQRALGEFNVNAPAVATEFAKLARGAGSMSEKEIAHYMSGFSSNASPSEFEGALNKLMELVQTQMGEVTRKYNETTHGRGAQRNIVSPQTAAILQKEFPDVYAATVANTTANPTFAANGVAAPAPSSSTSASTTRLQKTQTRGTATRVVYSDDGGLSWHP